MIDWRRTYTHVHAQRDEALARVRELEAALRGWEARDHDGEPPHNIERGTLKDGDWEVLVEDLTGEQADRIEDFIERLAALAASPEERGEAPTAVTGTYPARGVPDDGWEHDAAGGAEGDTP